MARGHTTHEADCNGTARRYSGALLLLATASLLIACSGGGGGGGEAAPGGGGGGGGVAAPAIAEVSGSFNHKATVTITGSGFGNKSQAAPVVWDDASSGTLPTDNRKWDGYYPIYPVDSTTYHLHYTTPIRGIGLPHTHITRYLAGAHGEIGAAGWDVMFWKNRTMGTYPQYTYISWYQRADDKWVFGGDNNYKMYDFSTGGQPYNATNWYTAYEVPFMDSPAATAKWVLNDDAQNTPALSLAWPDNNGHSYFWNYGSNPFAGTWSKIEMEIKWTNQSNGYIKQWDNGNLVVDYSGATDNYGGTARSEAVGGYARMYGQPNNWRYWADVYLDYSPARIVLANNAVLSAATIREVQIPTSWSAGSIGVSVNLGKFSAGQPAFLFVVDPTGVPNTAGFPVIAGNSSGSQLPAPPNLRVQ